MTLYGQSGQIQHLSIDYFVHITYNVQNMNIYPKAFTATELKNNPAEILNLAIYGGYEVMIEKYGEEVAKVIPVKRNIAKKNYKELLAEFYGSMPDFPDVTKDRKSRKYVKIFD